MQKEPTKYPTQPKINDQLVEEPKSSFSKDGEENRTTSAQQNTTPPKTTIATSNAKLKIDIQPKDGKQVSSLSIASIQRKKEWEKQHKPQETKEDLPSDPFTQETLEKYWKIYQEKKVAKQEQNLASLFQLDTPKIINDNTLEYTVPSSLNKVELEREFVYFLPFLRKALNNYSIVINLIVNASEEKKFIYTPEEKYQRLIEINPLLAQLRKELDLDL